MIWGKTVDEKSDIEFNRERRGFFALWPKRLYNGQWLWLQRYWRKYWSSWGCSGYDYYSSSLEALTHD